MKFKNILYYIVVLIIIGYGIFLRFTNIDMTETRLFITFWWQWLLMFALLFASYLGAIKSD